MLLWLKAAVMLLRFDPVVGVNTRIFVTMAFGRAAAALASAGGVFACAAWAHTGSSQGRKALPIAAAVKDFANVLRSVFTCLLSGMSAFGERFFGGHILPLIPGFTICTSSRLRRPARDPLEVVLASSPCLYCWVALRNIRRLCRGADSRSGTLGLRQPLRRMSWQQRRRRRARAVDRRSRVPARTDEELTTVIRQGLPTAGMPASPGLSDAEVRDCHRLPAHAPSARGIWARSHDNRAHERRLARRPRAQSRHRRPPAARRRPQDSPASQERRSLSAGELADRLAQL